MVEKGMIDASRLSIDQIHFLNLSERHMFMKLDFTCCNDAFIYKAVGIVAIHRYHVSHSVTEDLPSVSGNYFGCPVMLVFD